MKNYKERTKAVIDKVEERTGGKSASVENGGGTLSVRHDKHIRRLSLLALFLAALIALSLILFIPFRTVKTDLSAYSDSEYYGLIKVVSKLTEEKPRYKNNFEKMMSAFSGCGSSKNYDSSTGIPPASDDGITNDGITNWGTASPEGDNGSYVENTNNQVKAVTEADLLKRSDKYAFYLLPVYDGLELRIYGLNGENSSLVSSYKIPEEMPVYYSDNGEMYLSEDCNTVFVITQTYERTSAKLYTCIISLDVSDVKNVKESGRVLVSGSYISSRFKDGTILLFTNFAVNRKPDFSDKLQFLPAAGAPDDIKCLPAEDIIYSDDAAYARYTVVCAIDESSLEINSNYAFLDFSQNVYVSEENIFLTRTRSGNNYKSNEKYENYTEINCLYYADGGLEYVNKAAVAGTVLNQYSLDEYDGMLRVVTEVIYKDGKDSYVGASLYCIDLKTFETRASLEKFSPDGEKVYSVRFDGTTAYVCTAELKVVIFTDPVFAIDLSDLDNITYKDTGTITGYSMSLMKFKDDTLLGIGYGEFREKLKIELYRETENGVESVSVYEKSCSFSNQFKAYFINAENGLIGLSIYNYEREKYAYDFLLLLYDGYNLRPVETRYLGNNVVNDYTRTALQDGYIYVFTSKGFEVINWNAPSE